MTSILQFSDIHFGVEDKNAMAAVRDYAKTLSPDLALICGDITQSGKIEEFKAARDWIEQFDAPKIVTPGNHDTPMFGILHRIFDPFGRYNKFIAPLGETMFVDENIALMPYNTARGVQAKLDWSLGVVDLSDLAAKVSHLKAKNPSVLKMIAVHHPLIYPPVSPLIKETKRGEAAVKLLSDANIDGVLSGHVHAPFVVEREPGQTELLSIGSGTLSTRQRGKPASFNHIEIDSRDIRVTAINWTGDKFERAEAWTKSRVDLRRTA
ncbi:metallophosphoesterase family protein [Litorimonas sp. RW-G-Af-16]|uniref:metallophosphoesterase family protein n=1 Tax=Litorimonas sp. RW-G-Af-16 TaxID=3241168 RepID=UPI00390C5816